MQYSESRVSVQEACCLGHPQSLVNGRLIAMQKRYGERCFLFRFLSFVREARDLCSPRRKSTRSQVIVIISGSALCGFREEETWQLDDAESLGEQKI